MISTTENSTSNPLSSLCRMEVSSPGDSLLAEIKCSLCLLAPYPYVQFCKAGHVMCQRCSTLCHKCPRKSDRLEVCDQLIIPISLQSSLHQRMLRQSIVSATTDVGNTEALGSSKMEATAITEKLQSQVVTVGKCPFEKCDYVSLMEDDLLSHVTTVHQVPTVAEADAEIETRWDTNGRRIAVILNCFQQNFILLIYENEDGMVYMWMSQLNAMGSEINDWRVQLRLQKPNVEHSSEERLYSIQTVMDPSKELYYPDENCLILRKDYVLKKLSAILACNDQEFLGSKPVSSVFISISNGKINQVPYSPSSCHAEKVFPTNDDYPPVARSEFSSPSWELFQETSSAEFRRDVQLHGFVNRNYPSFVLKPPECPPAKPDCKTENPGTSKSCSSNVVDEPWPIPIRNPIFQQTQSLPGTVVILDQLRDEIYENSFRPLSSEEEPMDAAAIDESRSITPLSLEIDQKAQNLFEERKRQNVPERKVCIKSVNCVLRKPMPSIAQPVEPEKTELLKPEKSELLKPEKSELLKPEKSELLKPEKSELLKPEKSELLRPEKSELLRPEKSELLKSFESIRLPTILEANIENEQRKEFAETQAIGQPKENRVKCQALINENDSKEASYRDIDKALLEELELDGFEEFLGLNSGNNAYRNGQSWTPCSISNGKIQEKGKSFVRYKTGLIESK